MAEVGQCPAPEVLDIRLTFGMLVIATMLSSVLIGLTLLQAGLYWNSSALRDRVRNKLLVAVLVLCDLMSWILEFYTVWWYFVVNYAQPASLAQPIWSLLLEPGFTYTASFIAQIFFIEKIYLLTRNKFASALMFILALTGWGTGLGITGLVFALDKISTPLIDHINIIQKTASTLVEVLIAGFMCYFFKSKQTDESFSVTNGILNKLLLFALSRGVIMCLAQAFYTISYFAFHATLIWVIFHFALGKLSSNSVIATLNAREILRNSSSRPGVSSSYSLGKRLDATALSSSRQANSRLVFSDPQTDRFTPTYDDGLKAPVRVQLEDDAETGHTQRIHVTTEYFKHSG